MNLAIISTNKNKYSETFIHKHIGHLPFNIHFLFDGYMPKKYSIDKGITEHQFINKQLFWSKLFIGKKSNESEKLTQAIENYLIKNKITTVLCEYGPSGVELMHSCKKLNIPLVVHFHGYDAFRNDILNSYGKHYLNLFSIAKAIIVVSEDMKQQLIKLGCPQEKLHLIPYGIDIDFFKYDASVIKKYDFVFCGRFVPKKSPIQIIQSFSNIFVRHPNARIAMIGDGELLQDCKRLVTELKLDRNVFFFGSKTQHDVRTIYQQSKLFINHSVTTTDNDSEGTPVTILEAMACGLPVVASNHAGIKDVIAHNHNGFLIQEKDWLGFESQVSYCLLHYHQLEHIVQNSILTVNKYYQLKSKIDDLARVIKSSII